MRITATVPKVMEMGILRLGSLSSPAIMGRLFHPSKDHSAAIIATPKPLQVAAFAVPIGRFQWSQLPVEENPNMPTARPMTKATFRKVMAVCKRPEKATVRQFNPEKRATKPTAIEVLFPESENQEIIS